MSKKVSTQKVILLVHAMSPSKKFVLQKIKKMGLHLVCLSKEKSDWALPYVDKWILADLQNHKECLDAVKRYNREAPNKVVQGVVTFWDEAVLLTAHLAESLNLIGIPYEIAKKVKNKYTFRDFCSANGIMAPRHRMLRSKHEIPALEKDLKYPLVVKPVYGACSAYVVRVNNREELMETYDYVKNNIKSFWLASEWENFDLLIEEYIDGEEVDMDILVQNGKIKFYSISDNFNKSRSRFFVDSGQAIPSNLPQKEQDGLIKMAEETLEKLGVQNACIHFEAKYSPKGPCPIEVNMRMGGDYVYSYLKTAWRVDLVEQSINIALGNFIKIEKPERPYKYIIGWDLQPESSGILVELEVSEKIKSLKYFEEMYLSKEIGDAILRPPEGYDSLGWVTVTGDNSIDAQDNLQEVLRLINYKVVHFDQDSALGKTSRQSHLSAATVKKDFIIQAAKIEKVRRISLVDQRKLHIGIVGNKTHFNAENKETVVRVKFIEEELKKRGYLTTVFDFNNLDRAFGALRISDVNLVFNVSEGINNNEQLKSQATALLEALQIPFIGSSSLTEALCQDKIKTKKLLQFHNIPMPAWDYAYSLNDIIDKNLQYPLLVKPGNTENSMGITNSSVVTNKKALDKQMRRILVDLGRPVLVEEYIEGDEYDVSIIGNSEDDLRVLPLSRSIFKKMPKGYWHIYSSEAKKNKNRSYKNIVLENPAKRVNPKLESLITEIALDVYQIMKCRDYGRVGIRVDKDGNPYVLEIDTNPALNEHSEFVKSARTTGLEYGDLLEEIISLAVKRYQNKYAKFCN
jgi:D-alanine-D-alanine ligase